MMFRSERVTPQYRSPVNHMKEPAFGTENRVPFYHGDHLVYEWCQTLDEVILFVKIPVINNTPATKTDLDIRIQPRHLHVGLKGKHGYLNEELWSTVDTDESTWYIDGEEIRIECTKVRKGETWEAAFTGHGALDPFAQEQVRKQMMLERFQEEHPTFDFSQAQFSGQAPDPRTFLGGITRK